MQCVKSRYLTKSNYYSRIVLDWGVPKIASLDKRIGSNWIETKIQREFIGRPKRKERKGFGEVINKLIFDSRRIKLD